MGLTWIRWKISNNRSAILKAIYFVGTQSFLYLRNFPVMTILTLSMRVRLTCQVETDGALDTVTEFLMDQRLQGSAINLHDLVEAVDRWVGGDITAERAAHGNLGEELLRLLHAECGSGLDGGLLRQRHLPVQRLL
jgi:hypothetical protein